MACHVERWGNGDRTILVSPGLAQNSANWKGIVRGLPGIRWVVFDPRGQGRSPLGKTPYGLDDHVQDLMTVLERNAFGKPTLLGFSHGARIAAHAVAQYPDAFDRLIMVSCASMEGLRRNVLLHSWARCLELGGVECMGWASLPSLMGVKLLRQFGDLEMLVKGMSARNTREGLLAMFEGMRTYPPIETACRQIRIPTLVMMGTEDPFSGPQDGRAFAEWMPQARVSIYSDCGHTLYMEETKRFLAEIQAFLQAE